VAPHSLSATTQVDRRLQPIRPPTAQPGHWNGCGENHCTPTVKEQPNTWPTPRTRDRRRQALLEIGTSPQQKLDSLKAQALSQPQ
jgi:hypothetical protein